MKGLYPIRNKKLRAWWKFISKGYLHWFICTLNELKYALYIVFFDSVHTLSISLYLTSDAESSKASNINFAP